jgi:D-glycero-alpha-D-manno-heptose 1-phosphate guanylyltransferase
MGREAIVLSGGKGTRLQSVVADLPKPMAPIGDKPFLFFLLKQLKASGFERVILSVGYMFESIQEYFGKEFEGMSLDYAVELEPLGTGGGIRLAFNASTSDNVFIFNGDTLFDVDVDAFERFHCESGALLSLALKPMQDFDRYGTVSKDSKGRILEFKEKQAMAEGLINGGVYLIEKSLWKFLDVAQKFSFEKDVMEAYVQKLPFFGFVSEGYFIDIGIPEDYSRSQTELPAQF